MTTTPARRVFPAELTALRDECDASLDAYAAALDAGSDPDLAGFVEAVRYAVLGTGKRVRPMIVAASTYACGGQPCEQVVVAVELVHAYSLVHDDLPAMDDDDVRRGRPTVHRAYDEATAILVGDALQAEAFRLIGSAETLPAQVRADAVVVLAEAAGLGGMVAGQHLDVAGVGGTTLADLRAVHDRKTGALLGACAELGAVCADADLTLRAAFRDFGRELGWLFQLTDDLLDAVGDERATGRPSGSDARSGRSTALDVLGEEGLRSEIDRQLGRCLALCDALPEHGGALRSLTRFVATRDR